MLEVTGLDTFYGRARILDGVGIEVARGEVVALLGRNGAGKSTTLKSIIGLVRPAAGEVELDGRSLTGLPSHEICRAGLGYVPEDRRVFAGLTIMENLEVGRLPPRADAPHWTPERLFALFPNLAEMRDRPGGHTSGGEQQMLTIARTLMGNPRAILLDEPSEGHGAIMQRSDVVNFRNQMEAVRARMAMLIRSGMRKDQASERIQDSSLSWTQQEDGLFMQRSIPGFYDEIAAELE